MFACIITPVALLRWGLDGAPVPIRRPVRHFVGSAIMSISLPNASCMHSVPMFRAHVLSLSLSHGPPLHPSSTHPSSVLYSFDSSLSLSFFALHRSAPHRSPTLSRRFLRIDVIGLFALFRLCLALLSERCIIREVVPIGRRGKERGEGRREDFSLSGVASSRACSNAVISRREEEEDRRILGKKRRGEGGSSSSKFSSSLKEDVSKL